MQQPYSRRRLYKKSRGQTIVNVFSCVIHLFITVCIHYNIYFFTLYCKCSFEMYHLSKGFSNQRNKEKKHEKNLSCLFYDTGTKKNSKIKKWPKKIRLDNVTVSLLTSLLHFSSLSVSKF